MYFYDDYFSNQIHAFTVQVPHNELLIRMKSIVVTTAFTDLRSAHPMSAEEQWRFVQGSDCQNRFAEYLTPTHYTTVTPALIQSADLITPSADLDIASWVRRLSAFVHSNFAYDQNVTTVHTTIDQFMALNRGVCQDFAHYMIAVCRHRGIPARYVSGYHFVGDLNAPETKFQHASHAWVEAYIPGLGWKAFDPTNDSKIGERYVKLGHGQDYTDIVPVKGVYRGSARQQLDVTVTVSVIDE